MINLLDLNMVELSKLINECGEKPFRASQIFGWLAKGTDNLDEMKNVPASLKDKLREKGARIVLPEISLVQESKIDGTLKFLFEFEDGNRIETVFMRYKYGNSICLSSQAGCRMGCRFCASGQIGLERNLSVGEIYGQYLKVLRYTGEPIGHVVIMGTGEPFDNYENVSGFINVINDKNGVALGMRNITVSTCGIVPMIDRFAKDFSQVNLAISLHASKDSERGIIMPINKAYPIGELIEAAKRYVSLTSRRITFEYALINGKNDSGQDASDLAQLLKGMLCHVNLIPLNEVSENEMKKTGRRRAEEFRDYLVNSGIPATLRRELGADIDAACGQLRLKKA